MSGDKQKAIIVELKRIAAKHKGNLHAEDVVAFARNPITALHSHFDWEDSEAAAKWRLHQARNVIRVCVQYEPSIKKSVKVFVSLIPDRQAGEGYKALSVMIRNAEDRAQLLADALAELETFRHKYSALKELAGVFVALDKVKKSVA